MAPREITEFKFMGAALDQQAKELKDCGNKYEITTWILDELRTCGFNNVRATLDQKTDTKRLFKAKTIYVKGEAIDAPWDLDSPTKAAAITHYLMTDSTNIEACPNCQSKHSKGPCEECIAGGADLFKGACVNCYYSGLGTKCSSRKALMEAEEMKKRKAMGKFTGFTENMLAEASSEKLRLWVAVLEEPLKKCDEDVSPTKKQKK